MAMDVSEFAEMLRRAYPGVVAKPSVTYPLACITRCGPHCSGHGAVYVSAADADMPAPAREPEVVRSGSTLRMLEADE